MYNSTPHASTGVAPSALMFGRIFRDKLPAFGETTNRLEQEEVRDRDWEKKLKDAEYTDTRRQAKPSELREGDIVVCKRMMKENKLSTTFAPEEYELMKLKGSEATLRSVNTNREVHRNVAHLKRLPRTEPTENKTTDSTTVQEDRSSSIHDDTVGVSSGSNVTRPLRTQRRPAYLNEYHTDAVWDF